MKKLMVFAFMFILFAPVNSNAQYLAVRGLPVDHVATVNGTALSIVAMVDSIQMQQAIDSVLNLGQTTINQIIKHWRGHTTRQRIEKSICFMWACDIALTPQVATALLVSDVPVVGVAVGVNSNNGVNIYLGVMAHSDYVLAQDTHRIQNGDKLPLHLSSYVKDQTNYFRLFRVQKL